MHKLLAVVVLSLPMVALGQTIDLDINGVKITATRAAVIRKLGHPVSNRVGGTVPCSDGSIRRTLRYPGLVLRLESSDAERDFGVYAIEVTSRKWLVSGRLRIGASKRNVVEKFGAGSPFKDKREPYLAYFIPDGYASFYFKNNRLVKIAWEFNFC